MVSYRAVGLKSSLYDSKRQRESQLLPCSKWSGGAGESQKQHSLVCRHSRVVEPPDLAGSFASRPCWQAKVMKGCHCGGGSSSSRMAHRKQHESDPGFAITTMETDNSSKIMNQSMISTAWRLTGKVAASAADAAASAAAEIGERKCRLNGSARRNSADLADNESVNLASSWIESNGVGTVQKGYPAGVHYSSRLPNGRGGGLSSTTTTPAPLGGRQSVSRLSSCLRALAISRSAPGRLTKRPADSLHGVAGLQWMQPMAALSLFFLPVMLSACLVQAGFWTFYLPNFMKSSGYSELTDMIESVEKQINSTIDAHADALYFWRLMGQVGPGGRPDDPMHDDHHYYPEEESACEQVFPLFRDKAADYAEIDFSLYMKPLMLYREHLLQSRELWFPNGPKTKNILPRQYEQDLYKKDLELKIESFNLLANDPDLRQAREEMVNIWRNVKRNLDNSLTCLYLRYCYRHVAEDINQFALDMNLKSLQQAMEMLESAYKRVARYKEQDRQAIERIKDDMEREQNLVMID